MISPLKYLKNRSVGLALGSGGAKGFAHIAVLEFLDRMKIQPTMIAGSSIGSAIAVIYAMGNLPKLKKDLEKVTWEKIIRIIDPAFFRSGIISGKKVMEYLEQYIPKNIDLEQLPIPLALVATDYETGNAVVFQKGNALAAVRASISIPGIFVPVKHDERLLIDGNVANPLPISILKKMNMAMTIAVNLHPPVQPIGRKIRIGRPAKPKTLKVHHSLKEFTKKKVVFDDAVQKLLAKKTKTPSMVDVLTQTIEHLERQNTKRILARDPPNVLIEPSVRSIGNLEFHKAKQAMTEGRRACMRKKQELIKKIKRWAD